MTPMAQLPIQRVMIDTLEVDATIQQEHVADAEVTEHPVEAGADPADHVRQKPDVLTLSCIQSSTPITSEDSAPLGLASRVREAYAFLLETKNNGRLIPVVTVLRAYTNMVITSLHVTREARTGDALAFTVSLKRVTIVENLIVESTTTRGTKKTGKQGTSATSAATEERASVIFRGAQAVRRALK